MEEPTGKDVEHLRLLVIFHFVFGGLALLGVCIFAIQYAFMSSWLGDPNLFKDVKGGPPPDQVLALLKYLFVFIGIWALASGVLNLLSGMWLRQRRNRAFSLVVAGINCLHMPLGTILGIFTFIVLSRSGVVSLYEANS